MKKIKLNKRYVTIRFTHEEVMQLFMCVGQANQDGDHREWMKSANATKKELAALDSIMGIVNYAKNEVAIFRNHSSTKTNNQ